jgi:hypothetical protein
MTKKVFAVFQDCVLCGDKGRKKIAEFALKGVEIEKVGFTTELGSELCYQALKAGIGQMPFYTDGERFSVDLNSFLEDKTVKKVRKNKKKGNK